MIAQDKFCFRGVWYPFDFVRTTACKIANLDEFEVEDEEDLEDLITAIIKGAPTPCSNFIVALNEGTTY